LPIESPSTPAAKGRPHGSRPAPRREDPAPRGSVRFLQAALALGAVVLAGSSLLELQALRDDRERVADRIAEAPLTEETRLTLERRIARADAASEIRLAVATYLVETELDALARPATTADDPEAQVRRLELAADLAAEAFALRPSAWEAPTLQGAAIYLARRRSSDRRLVTEYEAWDAPLTRARRLAPGIDDPHRFAASAYLELWNALSPEKREEAVGLLRRAFASPRTFGRLIGAWLELADEPEDAMAAMPDLPHVWEGLQRELARRGHWSAFFDARERWRDALERSLEARLREAERHARGGDLETARELYLEVVATSPLEERFAPLVERALAAAPPGPWQPRLGARLRPRLERDLALDLVDRSSLPPELVGRLAGLVGDLPEPIEARAELAAGRLVDAERLERRAPLSRSHEDWQPYWIVKARELLARGHPGEAGVALARVAGGWRDHPAHLLVRRDVATAAGDTATLAVTERRLEGLAAEPLPPEAWRRARGRAETALYVGDTAESLRLSFAAVPGSSSVVEVLVDGRVVTARRARTGRELRVDVDLASGSHLVEMRTLAGADPVPGTTLAAGGRDPSRRRGAADDR